MPVAAKVSLGARPLTVVTPLGADVLLLAALSGHEEISHLFRFTLSVTASADEEIAFDKLLGQPVSVTLRGAADAKRYFHGICIAVSQGRSDARGQHLQLEVAPQAWLLTKQTRSRIFQAISVPDVLKKVFDGLKVEYRITGTFEPRDYVVQYRESDFDFASRLMEEEGIYYYFLHTADSHKMIVANTPQGHDVVAAPATVEFEAKAQELGERAPNRVFTWEKSQELTSGKVTLWDHSFELPSKHLEASQPIATSVPVGTVTHRLALSTNEALELYDFPGGYAQRFDGVDKGGADRAADVQKIFQDNRRTTRLRMEEEAATSVAVAGETNCLQFSAGQKFTLDKHSDANGIYVLTKVTHVARAEAQASGGAQSAAYSNSFKAIPVALPFRPQCVTEEPVVQGSQTAVVVGPSGEEIFTDKYGRVKVQFHWDREGKNDSDSSCWVRVATPWAGKQWGMVHIPRIGQEVVVDFLEGDPDQPIIVGSVYNAEQMPPYVLPDNKTQSGIKTRSSPKGGAENFNEICFEDKKGSELLYIRAEKDQTIAVENDESHWVGHDRELTVDNDEKEHVGNDRTVDIAKNESLTVGEARTTSVAKDDTLTIDQNRTTTVTKEDSLTVNGGRTVKVQKDESVTIEGKRTISIAKDDAVTVSGAASFDAANEIKLVSGAATVTLKKDGTITIDGKSITISASQSIELKGGGSSMKLGASGIEVKGMKISLKADGMIEVKAAKTDVGGDGMLTLKGGVTMIN